MTDPPGVGLRATEAVWFVSDPDGQADDRCRLLGATLRRLGVHSDRLRTVALLEEPLVGRRYKVRVTPCLVLDLGTRRIHLPGDPARLDAAALEGALARP